MPCDAMVRTQKERAAREAAIKALAEELERGTRTVVQNFDGTVSITDWSTTQAASVGWCEGCILRRLKETGSWEVQSVLAKAGITEKSFMVASHRGHSH